MPDFLKQRSSPAAVEQPPDVAVIVRSNINAVFTAASAPTDIRFSLPVLAKYGGWDTCIRASVTGATGKRLGERTFLVNIDNNQIGRREPVDDNHWCAKENYQKL
jgi:hypothetical protein